MHDPHKGKASPEQVARAVSDLKALYAAGQITLAAGNTITNPAYQPKSKPAKLPMKRSRLFVTAKWTAICVVIAYWAWFALTLSGPPRERVMPLILGTLLVLVFLSDGLRDIGRFVKKLWAALK